MFKRSFIALSLVAALSGCSDDGKNGVDGVDGINGTDGINATSNIDITLVGRAALNVASPEGAAEIVAYQTSKSRIYAINSSSDTAMVAIIDASNIDSSALTHNNEGVITNTNLDVTIELALNQHTAGDANSIAISSDQSLLAVAMAAESKTERGMVAVYDISGETPSFIKNIMVGYLPDMVTFNRDDSLILVANEGEPVADYQFDAEGSISLIKINDGEVATESEEIRFTQFNDQRAALEASGVVFANPTGRTIKGKLINTSVAEDLEPEYITVSEDNKKAYISLQENNALAVLDLESKTLEVKGLGFKDWSQLDFDASDKDGGINFKQYQGLYGMYQPDTIASFSWQGANFVVTANEGDGREYFFDSENEATCMSQGGLEFDEDDGCLAYTDESRAEDLSLAENFDYVANDDNDLGRLKVSTVMGDADQDGRYEKLYTYGGRSFSIWDQNGYRVFDSGDLVDKITASIHGEAFNNDEDENKGDTRSDAKGAEPEALAIGKVGDRNYAFVGLERMGGIMMFDITNPYNVEFKDYFINRGTEEGAQISGDLAPEGMAFIGAEHSSTGHAQLVIGNEISGTVSVWQFAHEGS